jgi:hypothetical protein
MICLIFRSVGSLIASLGFGLYNFVIFLFRYLFCYLHYGLGKFYIHVCSLLAFILCVCMYSCPIRLLKKLTDLNEIW